MVWAACCFAVGLAAARWLDAVDTIHLDFGAWLIGAGAAGAVGAGMWRGGRWTGVRAAAGVMLVCVGGAWWQARVTGGAATLAVPTGDSVLVDVEGVVDEEPYHHMEARGLMGRFDYRSPRTLLALTVDTMHAADGPHAATGGVIVDVPDYDGRARRGDRVRVIGWLSGLHGTSNPGERDFRRTMADRGIVGRVSLKSRGNLRVLSDDDHDDHDDHDTRAATTVATAIPHVWSATRTALADRAAEALHVGMDAPHDTPSVALLDLLLLGDRRGDTGELDDAFRRAGVSHVLAISGMHLAILAAGAWLIVIALTGRPDLATRVTGAVVLLYLLVVPARVPVLRAGVMTLGALWGLTSGRRPSVLSVMALAGLGLLIWRPGDLFSAGFQLSFGVVLGLVLFTSRVSRWLLPPRDAIIPPDAPRDFVPAEPRRERWRRWVIDYVAVTLVAWCVSLPLIAHHFGAVTPAGLVMGVVMAPVVAVLLWVGYVKLIVSLIWPAAGALLAGPLTTLGDWTVDLVRLASDVPGGYIHVPQPSPLWTAATLAVVFTLLGGGFRRRRLVGLACILICITWAALPVIVQRATAERYALTVDMFAVGDGSCYLVRSGADALVFDCGSSNYIDITTVSVGPALRAMGVTRAPVVVVSHPDLDHFSGVLELVDGFGVQTVVVTQPFLDEAARQPWNAAGYLLDALRERGVTIEVIAAGWRRPLGHAVVEAIWPPPGAAFERNNDGSIVLSIRAAGRRVLFSGDVQEEAMTKMLDAKLDLRADVVELPHHGSMVPAAPAWLEAVNPSVVLQSTGDARLRVDKWAETLKQMRVRRHVTAWHGMTELHVGHDGTITADRYLEDSTGP